MINIFKAGLLLIAISASARCQITPIPAWFVTRNSDLMAGPNVTQVTFPIVLVNTGLYNITSHIITIPVHGTYYHSISAGVSPGRSVSVYLESGDGSKRYIGLENTNVINDGVSIASRGLLRDMLALTDGRVAIDGNTAVHASPANRMTAWTGFMYEEVARTFCAASAVRNQLQDGYADPLTFNYVAANIGAALAGGPPFNVTTNTFTTCIAGYYFFHLTAGVVPQREVQLFLIASSNPGTPICGLTHNAVSTVGYDTTSRSVLIFLDQGVEVKVLNNFGSALYSNDGWQTSVSFLGYGLQAIEEVVAFCAARNQSWEGLVTLAPVRPYEVVLVNEKKAFDELTGIFTAPMNGSYFVSFSAGADQQKKVDLALWHDGDFVAKIERTSTTNIGTSTLSRDVIVDMLVGETLHLEARAGSALYSAPDGLQTSFTVMRLKLVSLIDPGN